MSLCPTYVKRVKMTVDSDTDANAQVGGNGDAVHATSQLWIDNGKPTTSKEGLAVYSEYV